MYCCVCVHSQSQRPLTRTMPRSRQRMRLCLAGMVCLPVGGGLPTQAFLGVAARPPRGAITSGRDATAAGATRLKPAGGTATAAAAVSGTLKRSLRRPRASTALMSRAVFPSVSRTPLFPGGIYEGEKKERGGTEEAVTTATWARLLTPSGGTTRGCSTSRWTLIFTRRSCRCGIR